MFAMSSRQAGLLVSEGPMAKHPISLPSYAVSVLFRGLLISIAIGFSLSIRCDIPQPTCQELHYVYDVA